VKRYLNPNWSAIENCGFCSNRILLYFPLFVCSCVTGVTSHISHIYKGINAMLIIRGSIKPYIFWIKIILAIFLAKTRPDKTSFSALTNLTIDFGAESALFTLSCLINFCCWKSQHVLIKNPKEFSIWKSQGHLPLTKLLKQGTGQVDHSSKWLPPLFHLWKGYWKWK